MTQPQTAPLPIRRATFAVLAEEAIQAMIADGRLAPGARLNENQIAEALQISRGPVREAIQRLATDGLVTIRQHRGAFVTEVSDTQLRELYDVRIALETFAVRRGIERGDEVMPIYRSMLELNLAILERPEEDHISPDFHRQLVAASGSEALSRAHAQAIRQIALARVVTIHDPDLLHRAAGHHVPVLELLLEGDVAAASARLERHLVTSLERTLTRLHVLSE